MAAGGSPAIAPPPRRSRAWAALLLPLCLVFSCASGARWPDPLREPARVRAGNGDFLWELRGVLHVHSRYSHDSTGRIAEILDAAAATGSDFVIVTDHDRSGALPYAASYSWQGRTIVLLIGIEYSSRIGHLLDLFPRGFHHPKIPPQELIDRINRQGGFPVVAHPTDERRPWQDWNVSGLQGLEVYNTVADMREDIARIPGRWLRAMLGLGDPVLASVDRPSDNLALWQALERKGQALVGVGACNAHGRRGGGRLNWDDYRNGFALHSNRVWARSFDAAGIEEAVRAGRLYVAFDALGEPAGFDFRYRRGANEFLFGENVAAGDAGEFLVSIPAQGEIALYRDGSIVATAEGMQLRHASASDGVWRVEVMRRDPVYGEWRPWIITNPIRVGTPAQPEVPLGSRLPPHEE